MFVAYDQKDTCLAQTYVINFRNRIGELGPGDRLLCFLCNLLLITVIEQGSYFLGTAVLLTRGGYDGGLLA